MPFRLIAAVLACLITASLSSVARADEDEFAIGRFDGGKITNIMYYRNGSWVTPATYLMASKERMSLETYAKTFWNSGAGVFQKWYPINAAAPAAIQSEYLLMNNPHGCESAEMAVHTDGGGKGGAGWVATRQGGLRWHDFETVGHVVTDPERHLMGDYAVTPVAPEYEALAAQVKSRWAALEAVKHPKAQGDDFSQQLARAGYDGFLMRRASLPDGKTLLYFLAVKQLHAAHPAEQDGTDSIYVWYRGWALVEPNGRASWPSAEVLLPEDNAEWAAPFGVLEFGGKQFLIAQTSVEWQVEQKAYEFVNGKFNYRAKVLIEGCAAD